MNEAARKLRNAYQSKYRREHPDKIRQYNSNYWEKKAASYTPEVQAREMQSQGYTQREIAEQLNISVGTVNAMLNKT